MGPVMVGRGLSCNWIQQIVNYRIMGNFGVMEILALLADDKNTPN